MPKPTKKNVNVSNDGKQRKISDFMIKMEKNSDHLYSNT